jgi:hypothetical protein
MTDQTTSNPCNCGPECSCGAAQSAYLCGPVASAVVTGQSCGCGANCQCGAACICAPEASYAAA